MNSLNNGCCNGCSKHDKVSLENATKSFITSEKVDSVLLLLSELESSLSDCKISDNDEQKGAYEGEPKRYDFEQNPSS